MTGLVRKAMLLAACGLFVAGVAAANVPDPTQSDCPTGCIYVVGSNGTVADPIGTFCVVVRNSNGVPINGALVQIDFSACDVVLCPDQLDPDATVDCNFQSVFKTTPANGTVCFSIMGKSKGGLGCGGAAPNCVKILAEGVVLCTVNAPTFDLNNDGGGVGVGGTDLSAWLDAFFCGTSPLRADYTCDGSVGGDDLSAWLTEYFTGNSAVNCDPKCP
jgi:hypothetical protein